MTRSHINRLTPWITAAAVRSPERLAAEVATRLAVSPRTAGRALAQLVELNWLVREGDSRRVLHRPGLLRQVVQRYALDGLAEDRPWAVDFAPYFVFPAALQRMVQHSFCELLNNAIEHSAGTQVTVSLRQTASHAQLLVSDNGRGLFRQIADTFAIDDARLAMLELSKGKLTSQPDRHSGQGLYFTVKLADVFDLRANAHAFQQRSWDSAGWLPQRALSQEGTSVYAAFALDTSRTLDGVRRAHSVDGTGYSFDRTIVPVRLAGGAAAGLESRAQARRIALRLEGFRRAELDFSGVTDVGHAFADELLRVLPAQRPALQMVPVNLAPAVAAMLHGIPQGAASNAC